ncbi:cupin domain-containing protein [Methylobacterium sp. JK268]
MAESDRPQTPDPGRFDLIAEALGLPDAAGAEGAVSVLIDRAAACLRVQRLDRPVPPHRHRTCDEYLYVLSGRGTCWSGDPAREAAFGPGELLVFPRGAAHALPRILAEPLVVLAIDAPRRPPEDEIPLEAETAAAESGAAPDARPTGNRP